jgi:hypothetical protein
MFGCGGGSSSSSGSGTIVIGVTDTKPMLPAGTEEVLITFVEVSVHRPGGGWTSLPLAQTPYSRGWGQVLNYQFRMAALLRFC